MTLALAVVLGNERSLHLDNLRVELPRNDSPRHGCHRIASRRRLPQCPDIWNCHGLRQSIRKHPYSIGPPVQYRIEIFELVLASSGSGRLCLTHCARLCW